MKLFSEKKLSRVRSGCWFGLCCVGLQDGSRDRDPQDDAHTHYRYKYKCTSSSRVVSSRALLYGIGYRMNEKLVGGEMFGCPSVPTHRGPCKTFYLYVIWFASAAGQHDNNCSDGAKSPSRLSVFPSA